MKILLRFVLFLSGLCLLLCALFVFFGVSDQPDIAVGWKLTHDDVVRAQKILHEGAKTKPDDIGSIELNVLW